jgi:hypothetical protein
MADDFAGGVFDPGAFVTSGAAPAGPGGIRAGLNGGTAFTYAIAGLARAGGTRAAYLPGIGPDRVIVWVRGANMVKYVWKGSISVVDNLFQDADTCTFRTFDWAPEPLDDIVIAAGSQGRRYFSGIVDVVQDDKVSDPLHHLHQITCIDGTREMDALSVFGHWSGVAADIAMREILALYAPGTSAAGISSGAPSITDLTFDGETKVSGAFDRITQQIGWTWFRDPYDTIWAFDKKDAFATPLFQGAPGLHYDNLTIAKASNQIKTRVNVKGGGGTTTIQYAPGTTVFVLDTVEWYPAPPFRVYADGHLFTVNTVDAGTKTITIDPPGPIKTFAQSTKFQIFVTSDNLEAQAFLRSRGHATGIIEETLSDERRNADGALALAAANSGAFGYPRLTGSYTTVLGRAHSGDRLLVHLPYRRIWTEAQVQSVTTTLIYAPYTVSKSVTFSDTKLITFRDILRARERARKDR